MEKIVGYVDHIVYRNAENGYTVLNLVGKEIEITCVGIFSSIAEGENMPDETLLNQFTWYVEGVIIHE